MLPNLRVKPTPLLGDDFLGLDPGKLDHCEVQRIPGSWFRSHFFFFFFNFFAGTGR